jgi:hypothetical protein
MALGIRKIKTEGGNGGGRGHSNMTHWDYTEEIKRRSRKARRSQAKTLERKGRLARTNDLTS